MRTRTVFLCAFSSCGACILRVASFLRRGCMLPIRSVRGRVPLLRLVPQTLCSRLSSQPGLCRPFLRDSAAAALTLTDQDDARSKAMPASSSFPACFPEIDPSSWSVKLPSCSMRSSSCSSGSVGSSFGLNASGPAVKRFAETTTWFFKRLPRSSARDQSFVSCVVYF